MPTHAVQLTAPSDRPPLLSRSSSAAASVLALPCLPQHQQRSINPALGGGRARSGWLRAASRTPSAGGRCASLWRRPSGRPCRACARVPSTGTCMPGQCHAGPVPRWASARPSTGGRSPSCGQRHPEGRPAGGRTDPAPWAVDTRTGPCAVAQWAPSRGGVGTMPGGISRRVCVHEWTASGRRSSPLRVAGTTEHGLAAHVRRVSAAQTVQGV